jgi:threonyl-tRNA synthetase
VDDRLESLGRKVAEAKSNKANHILVIGDQEVESKKVSWQQRGAKEQQKISPEDLRDLLCAAIANRD